MQRARGVLPLRPFACSVVAAQANVAAIPFPGAHALVASSRRVSCEAVDSSVSAMTIFIDGLHLCCTAMRKCPDFTCHYVNTRHTHTHTYTRALVCTRAVIGENIHEKFTWQKAFSPISQDLACQGPELNEEQRRRKANPSRGKAVQYWNRTFLNLSLRSPNFTACGNIE